MRIVDFDFAMVGEQGREMRVRTHAEHRDVKRWLAAQLLDKLPLVFRGSGRQHGIRLFWGSGRDLIRVTSVSRHFVDVSSRHEAILDKLAEPSLARLLGVAFVIIGRNETLIAPPHVHTAPIDGIGQRAFTHHLKHVNAIGAAGHGNVHTLPVRLGQQVDDGQQCARGHGLRQYFGIRIHNGLTFCHIRSLYDAAPPIHGRATGCRLTVQRFGLIRSQPCVTTSA